MQARRAGRESAINAAIKQVDELMTNLNEYSLGKQYILPYLQEHSLQFKTELQKEEVERPSFQMDVTVLDQLDNMKQALESSNKTYSVAFKKHQSELNRVRAELDAVHDKIQEAQSEAMLSSLKKLVDFQVLYNNIQDEEDKIDMAVQNLGCCARLFSCNTDHIQKMQARLDRLKKERKALGSNDYETFRQALTKHLESQRDRLQTRLDVLISNVPNKDTDTLSNDIANHEANIEEYWFMHTHFLKPEAMLHLISFYETICHLREKVLKNLDASLDKAGENFYHQMKPIKALLRKFDHAIKKIFNEFFCVSEEDSDQSIGFNVYHKRFKTLKESDQEQLRLHPDISHNKINELFVEPVIGMEQETRLKAVLSS